MSDRAPITEPSVTPSQPLNITFREGETMKGTLRIRMRDGGEHVLVGVLQAHAQNLIQRWQAGRVGVITLATPAGQTAVDLRQATSVQFTR